MPGLKLPESRQQTLLYSLIILLVLALVAETAIILEQKRVNDTIQAQSAQVMDEFLKRATPAQGRKGTDVLLHQVRFCWSSSICINAPSLTATAEPLGKQTLVNFDYPNSFMVRVHNAAVTITPQTLQGMFNESVFNYPGSTLRNLSVNIHSQGGENRVRLAGSLNYLFWIPFEMDTLLSVNRQSNTLVIAVQDLKVFGFLPAKWLIDLQPFNLEKLLKLPPNRHLLVYRNQMMVKPFGLFPPPRIEGTIDSVVVLPRLINLRFTGNSPAYNQIPQPGASHYIYLQGGSSRFGKLGMEGTHIQVIDRQPQTLFQFSLQNYLSYLPPSQVQLTPNGGVVVHMPDHNLPASAPTKPVSQQTGNQANNPGQPDSSSDGIFSQVRRKLKDWFGI
jgi:hypothetical protein